MIATPPGAVTSELFQIASDVPEHRRDAVLDDISSMVLVVRESVEAQQKKKEAPPPIVEYKSGIVWPEPEVVTPGKDNGPPSDATVLFDGIDLSKWNGGDR